MSLTNKHIVLILIIIIIFVFIYNYDVYVVPKNEQLCKPLYVTKRELTPEERADLNQSESIVFKETFGNLLENNFFEGFNMTQELMPPRTLSTYIVPHLTDANKIRVIDSVVKVLAYIPTIYNENEIKELVEYFAMIYNSSENLDIFYENIAKSEKIFQPPYNSQYAHLILFLIGKFDSDLNSTSFNTSQLNIPMQTNSDFDIKPEDIPMIITQYNIEKESDEKDEKDEKDNKDDETTKKKSKKSKKNKINNLAKMISNSSDAIYSGIPNTSNGPSVPETFSMVDRDTMATRVNSTHSAPYSANFSGINNYENTNSGSSGYGSGSGSGPTMSSSSYPNSDYITSLQDSFNFRASDYLGQQLDHSDYLSSQMNDQMSDQMTSYNLASASPIDSFNSVSSGYANAF
jgi:hypothetical protein